jgi:hypothetical protein
MTWHFLFPLSWSPVSIFSLELFAFKKGFLSSTINSFFCIQHVIRADLLVIVDVFDVAEKAVDRIRYVKAMCTFVTVITFVRLCNVLSNKEAL